jgi:transglutaminase-like putative cysteine protease
MRSRSALLYALPAVLIATGWLRLEEEPRAGGTVFALVLLAFAPALVRPWWGRALAAAGAILVGVWIALDVSPFEARPFDDGHNFVGPALDRFRDGFLEYYDVPQPFDPFEFPLMHAVVLIAIFGFCLAVALGIAARRPLVASAALLVGAAWPTTLVPTSADYARGALTLVAVLTLLAAGGKRPPRVYRPAVLAAAALVAVSLVAVASSAVAKDEFLSWRDWDFYDAPDDPVGVRYVWDADYGGIDFPDEATKVLTVTGPTRALYWRATTLDLFDGNRWIEHLAQTGVLEGPVEIQDPLLPSRAQDPANWMLSVVKVEALRDDHLPGASMPVAYDTSGLGPVLYRAGGVAELPDGLERNQQFRVWSYAPRPTPVQLARARLDFGVPEATLSRFLELTPGVSSHLFGSDGRDAHLGRLFANEHFSPYIGPYRPLYEQAREVVGQPDTPYAAVVALEAWFRSEGGFAYDEQPSFGAGAAPPLVHFVTRGKEGYCQLYAGAMALMLRYLGIPARVAVGFTSGSYEADTRRWTVTDHNAHAWVEVWFQGWGWLPFDPTPARGQLSGSYTAASENFDSAAASRLLEIGGGALQGINLGVRGELAETRLAPTNPLSRAGRSAASAAAEHGGSLLRLIALLLTVVAGTIALGKLVLRRARYLARDPRRIAAASRRELADFLLDQRVSVARSATVEELGAIVESQYALDAEPFVRVAGRARYAQPSEAGEAVPSLRRAMRALRRDLRRRLGPVARFRGAVSLRSFAS